MDSLFFLIWQDPESRRWLPVGRLERYREIYTFVYTQGSLLSSNFRPFGLMSKTNVVYISKDLFPIFSNRVLSDKRPEFDKYSKWAGFDTSINVDPLSLMGRMGGVRATDNLQVYQVPERNARGMYNTTFFCHGIRHMPEFVQDSLFLISEGSRIYPMFDEQNEFDNKAIAFRTAEPAMMIGYCPRHLTSDIRKLQSSYSSHLLIKINKINLDAPSNFKVLCEATAAWPDGFNPCDGEEYKPIVDVRARSIYHQVMRD